MTQAKTYKLVFDKEFTRSYRKLGNSLQIKGDKKIKRLKTNPDCGKPLKYFVGLRELYLDSSRIYYLVQNSEIRLLFLDVVHKDEQKKYLNKLTPEKIKQLSQANS